LVLVFSSFPTRLSSDLILVWAVLRFGLKPAGLFALGVALLLLPVVVRNSVVGGGFYLTTSQFGPNFFIGNHAGANGTYQSLRYRSEEHTSELQSPDHIV